MADTNPDAPKTRRAIAGRKAQFLCGGVLLQQLQERYLSLRGELKPVDYHPDSQAKRPAEERDQYKAVEVAEHMEGQVDGKAVQLDYRMIFVWSESKARQEATTRERHTAKVVAEFEAVQRDLGRYSLKTTEAIVRRLEAAKGKYVEGALFDYRLVKGPDGPFQLTWQLDAGALERWRNAVAKPGGGLRAEDQPAGAGPPVGRGV